MKKKLIVVLTVMAIVFGTVYADDVDDLTRIINEVGQELGYNLKIVRDFRPWDDQINEMINISNSKGDSILYNWYSWDSADAIVKYKTGNMTKDQLLTILKKDPLIQHPWRKAVDIGVNSSRLSTQQKEEVVSALKKRGLHVKDETVQNHPCIHVSKKKYNYDFD